MCGLNRETLGATIAGFRVIRTPAEVVKAPTPWADKYFREIDHPAGKKLGVIMKQWPFSKTLAAIRNTAPKYGKHTEEILTELLDHSWVDIIALKDKRVIR